MEVIERDINSIRPYENNPRFNDEAVDFVANSLRDFDWQQPIVVDKDGVIINRWEQITGKKAIKIREGV